MKTSPRSYYTQVLHGANSLTDIKGYKTCLRDWNPEWLDNIRKETFASYIHPIGWDHKTPGNRHSKYVKYVCIESK